MLSFDELYTSAIIAFIMVSHFAAALFTGFMVYTARPGSSLFSWHPTLMATAFALLMFEAILVFSPESSLLQKYSRAVKVEVHWILQTLSGILGGTGFAIIYVNKEFSGKPHFTTWHGLLGLLTVIYVVVQSLGGALVKYPQFAKGFKRAQLKLYHATSGLCLFSLVCGTIALGLFSNWFTSKVTGTPWYACVGCVSIIVLSVMNQVVAAYQPRRPSVG